MSNDYSGLRPVREVTRNDARRLEAARRELGRRFEEGINCSNRSYFLGELARVVLDAADKVDEARRPVHLVEIRDQGYGVQHPMACRPNLLACAVERKVQEMGREGFLAKLSPGRYSAEVWKDGLLRVVQMPVSPDCRDANHHKCYGDALDELHDVVRACACTCHDEHPVGGEAA